MSGSRKDVIRAMIAYLRTEAVEARLPFTAYMLTIAEEELGQEFIPRQATTVADSEGRAGSGLGRRPRRPGETSQ